MRHRWCSIIVWEADPEDPKDAPIAYEHRFDLNSGALGEHDLLTHFRALVAMMPPSERPS